MPYQANGVQQPPIRSPVRAHQPPPPAAVPEVQYSAPAAFQPPPQQAFQPQHPVQQPYFTPFPPQQQSEGGGYPAFSGGPFAGGFGEPQLQFGGFQAPAYQQPPLYQVGPW